MDKDKMIMNQIINILAKNEYPLWAARHLLMETVKELERTAVIPVPTPERE